MDLNQMVKRMIPQGERAFLNFPPFAAWMYDRVFQTAPLQQQYEEIAQDLSSRVVSGSVLDVGTGPGWLLYHLHRIRPDLQLYGMDISPAMVNRARRKLAGLDIRLETCSVAKMPYSSNLFESITCTGSFYLWDRPEDGLLEIHRVLKNGHTAELYETVNDVDADEFEPVLERNAKRMGMFMRYLSRAMLHKQLQMTYKTHEVRSILRGSIFGDQFEMKQIELVGMPIWIRISLYKHM